MNIINEIRRVFPPIDDRKLDERYNTLDLEYRIQIDSSFTFEEERIRELSSTLEDSTAPDSWILSISEETGESVFLGTSKEDINIFLADINELIEFTTSNSLTLKFHIEKKNSSGLIRIYDLDAFDRFVRGLNTIQFLNILNKDLLENGVIYFKILSDLKVYFSSRNLRFSSSSSLNSDISFIDSSETKSREVCYFANQAIYPYSPKHFWPLQKENTPTGILIKLEKLAFVFSIINIFDLTSITEKQLDYKLNGYKSIEGKIDIDKEESNSITINTYFKIFEWIYSDQSNIAEKIGISRNILSIYLKEDSLDITENAFYSIQSGFKTYLQENLNRYLEIRKTINEQLIDINQNANNSIEKYLDNYQKSSITFVSFFISTLVITVLSNGQFQNVFTKDATILALSLIAISLLYLVFSRWNLKSEKERLKIRYGNLKGRFRDLLVKEDIEKILQDDKEFEDEINFIESRAKAYTFLWVGTALIILIAILSLSSYINWNTLVSFLKKFF
jgi:hypothetical protein